MADQTGASLEAELEALLSEPMDSVLRRERETFDEQTAPFSDRLVLFGAGNLGRKTLAGLRQAGIEPLAFTDNNQALWDTEVEGVRVLSPEKAAHQFGENAAFVVTIWDSHATAPIRERVEQLRALGCARVATFVPLFWKMQETLLPHCSLDVPHTLLQAADELRAAFGLWADEASRAVFLSELRWQLQGEFHAQPRLATHPIYFPGEFALGGDEYLVDCGAYDGDTIAEFLRVIDGRFQRILAFEPDPASLSRLQEYIHGLPADVSAKIRVSPCAVGAETGKVRFDATGTIGSAISDQGIDVEVVTLDDVLAGETPTIIKMDIEGAELDALRGAQNTIVDHKPNLAICVYHLRDDIWQIPRFLSRLNDDFCFYLRVHDSALRDLVCYAVPADRLPGI